MRTTWTVFKRYIPGGGEGDVWGNLLHHPSAYSLFSVVILHNFNDFRTNLLRFWPTFWVGNGRRRATLLLVLGVSFWSICCHVCYCCKLYEFVGNFFFFFWFVGGLHSWFLCVDHKLCIRHVTAQSELAQTVFRGEAGKLSFVYKLMIKSFDYAAISRVAQ